MNLEDIHVFLLSKAQNIITRTCEDVLKIGTWKLTIRKLEFLEHIIGKSF